MAALGPALGALGPAAFASLASSSSSPANKGLPPSAYIPAGVLAGLQSMGINPDDPNNNNDEDEDESDAPSPSLDAAQLAALNAYLTSMSADLNKQLAALGPSVNQL